MAYEQLTRSERDLIATYVKDGFSQRAIGKKIRRSHGTVGRELKRNTSFVFGYTGEFADFYASRRRTEANAALLKIHEEGALALHIFEKLRRRWSPETISVMLKRQKELPYVGTKTIYTFIKERHKEFKRYLLILSRNKRHPRNGKKHELIPNRRWIDERPNEVTERKILGHWEGDTIVGGTRKDAIATFVERVSDKFMAGKMKDRTSDELNRVALELFEPIPPEKRRSCTDDNGPEFVQHEVLEHQLSMLIYFAHPYHSWERGINEYHNRELRRFFPKGLDFKEVEKWELDWAVELINNRPRKRLNYQTPNAVFSQLPSGAL